MSFTRDCHIQVVTLSFIRYRTFRQRTLSFTRGGHRQVVDTVDTEIATAGSGRCLSQETKNFNQRSPGSRHFFSAETAIAWYWTMSLIRDRKDSDTALY